MRDHRDYVIDQIARRRRRERLVDTLLTIIAILMLFTFIWSMTGSP